MSLRSYITPFILAAHLLVPEAAVMKEPGKTYAATILVALVVVWILSEPQPLIAQRAGAQPYPPPRANPSSNPHASPIGADPRAPGTGDGTSENRRREKSGDTETILLRRRVAAELAEDFERLRRINREKIAPLSSSASLDYKELSQAVGEINTRAKRIKANSPLALKEKKAEKSTYDADAARLRSMLPELSRLIDSFLGSPVFHVTSINDDELRSTAGRDLAGIIRLSETINKIAKRLARASTQPA
jgi:hypothetical protein